MGDLEKRIKKLERCCCRDSISCCYEELPLDEAYLLAITAGLAINKLYKITNVHRNKVGAYELLYDDGNNAGTDIYLNAITPTQFSVQGWGEFYNLRYTEVGYGDILLSEAQIQDGGTTYVTDTDVTTTGGSGTGMLVDTTAVAGIITAIVIADAGTGYVSGDIITVDGGDGLATFTYVVGRNLYNIWDGDNPNPLVTSPYAIDDVVYWGGYAWRNVNGNIGTAIDILTLDSEWEKIPYSNDTYYVKVLDEIEYDFANDWIQRRTSGTIDIFFPYAYWHSAENNWFALSGFFSVTIHAISATQWGNPFRDLEGDLYGVGLITANDAYLETINFKGKVLLGVTANHYSLIHDHYWGYNTETRDVMLDNRSFLTLSVFDEGAKVYDFIVENTSWIDDVTLTGPTTDFKAVEIRNSSWIQSGDQPTIFSNSIIDRVILSNGSYLTDISILDSSYFSHNSYFNGSYSSGTMVRSSLTFSSFEDISYATIDLVDTTKSIIKAIGTSPTLETNLQIEERNSRYDGNNIEIFFAISFTGLAGHGAVGPLHVPDVSIPTDWYIDTVIVSHSIAPVAGVGSYITLGIATDDVDSGLDSTSGLVATLAATQVSKYTTLPNTFTTARRFLVGAVNVDDITDGLLLFQVFLKRGGNN